MAVIHISEAEAARDFSGLIAKVHAGDTIQIDGETADVRISKVEHGPGQGFLPRYAEPRLLSEMIAELERMGSKAALDEGFEDHLNAVLCDHERAFDPWDAS